MAAAIVQAGGGQQAFDNFATAAIKGHDNTSMMTASATQLAGTLLKTIGNTAQAEQEFDSFALKLGFTKEQADELWDSVNQGAAALTTADPAVTKISQDFDAQGKAASTAQTQLATYSNAVKQNGVWSDQAESARYQLVKDMTNAGIKASVANAAVNAYNNAVLKNGADSKQAEVARAQLVKDIINADTNSKQGAADLEKYTEAIANNGAKSQAAQSVRAQLIKDLENSGISASQAKTLVDELTTSIEKIPHSELIKILMSGSGSYSISEGVTAGNVPETSAGVTANAGVYTRKASGGLVRGGSGRPRADDIPALLSHDEFVVQAPAVHKYGVGLLAGLNAMHLADGGLVTGGNRSVLTGQYATTVDDAFKTRMEQSMLTAMQGSVRARHGYATGGLVSEDGPQFVQAPYRAAAVTPPGGRGDVHIEMKYYGSQWPTPEQQQATIMGLTRAVGVAG
jgi:hypothetical protein